MELLLKQSFQLQEGCQTSVDTILSCLGFGAEQQKIVSRHVKELFPGVFTRRENKHGCKQYPCVL